MSRIYDFLRECGAFHVLTVDGDAPVGRPFGAVMEHDDALYISTSTTKDVYRQLTANPAIQLLALNPGTREWLRVSGQAVECRDTAMKRRMLEACPVLAKRFPSAECETFALIRIDRVCAQLHSDAGLETIE